MAPSTAASPPQKRTRASFVPSAAATSTSTPPPPTQSSLRLRQRHNLFQSKTIDDKLDHEPSPKRVKSNEGQDLTEGSPSSSLSPAPPLDPPKPKPKPKPKAKSRPSKVPASSTGPFLPVSNLEFVQKYAVEGMQEAEVYYMPAFVDRETASLWREELQGLDEWYRPKLKVYGREIQQSRHIAAFSTEPGLHLQYSGHPVEMHHPFPPLLTHIATLLRSPSLLGPSVHFNHAMLNRYEDGSIYIGKHCDNVENKVIVTVSLGADRTWIMERKKARGKAAKTDQGAMEEEAQSERKKWTLENGSLLVMQGATQYNWTHEIPKEAKIKEPRISITFRQLVY